MKSNKGTAQLLMFIRIILIELSTRAMNKDVDKENVNFTELLNDTFVTTENLRNELKKFVGQSDSDLICNGRTNRTIVFLNSYIQTLMTFQNKWNSSYTGWLSSFKAQRANKNLLVTGEEHLHLNYQTLYPNFRKFHWETERIMQETQSYIELYERYQKYLENELDWQTKSFIHKLFNSKPKIGEQP